MVQINSEFSVRGHRRQLLLGGLLLMLSLLCVAMTIMFVFVNNSANRRVEDIRQQYRAISDRREARVAELTSQLVTLQKKTRWLAGPHREQDSGQSEAGCGGRRATRIDALRRP